jgi:uncharacterized RDD family membrane protein YckC
LTDYSDPYAAPAAPLAEPAPQDFVLAERGTRLAAALIDGALTLLIYVPLLAFIPMFSGAREPGGAEVVAVIGAVALVAIGLIVWNCLWLHESGQTPGKRAMGIRIVCRDGSRATLGRLVGLRLFAMFLIIMVFGVLSALVDKLLIFGDERRCLHDLIADTIVVQA